MAGKLIWRFDCQRIALARDARGVQTQAELARRIGVAPQQVGLWENGTVKPGQESLEKIMDALETPPQFFFVQSARNGNDCGNSGNVDGTDGGQ